MSGLLLIVRLAGERVAVPAGDVEAIVEIGEVTPIPRAPANVAGLAALRSRVVTVVDCRASLGAAPIEIGPPREAMLVVVDGHPYALLVDGVEDVVEPSGEASDLQAALAPGWARLATATVEADGDLLLLLDLKALIALPAPALA